MSRPVLTAELRKGIKKKNVGLLRREGLVPAIVYGNNIENKNIQLKKNEVEKVFNKYEIGSSVDVEINGKTIMTIIKDIQKHITKQDVMHIDFQELTAGEKVRVKIPLHLVNKSLVENARSVVQEQLNEIEIQTLPKYLPQAIQVDVSGLEHGETIKVCDLDIYNDENIEILSDSEQIIALLANISMEEAAVAEEEPSLTDLY